MLHKIVVIFQRSCAYLKYPYRSSLLVARHMESLINQLATVSSTVYQARIEIKSTINCGIIKLTQVHPSHILFGRHCDCESGRDDDVCFADALNLIVSLLP